MQAPRSKVARAPATGRRATPPCRAGRANLQSPCPCYPHRKDDARCDSLPALLATAVPRRSPRRWPPTATPARPSGSPTRAGPTSPRPTPSPARCSTALGYAPEVKTLSVPIGYQAMKDGEIDVFLGNWMPAQQHFRDDLDAAKAAEVIGQNLDGAKFTLAVPTAAATELGVADFKDLAAHGDAFDEKIYGIETGAPANQNLQKMIDADDFGLGDWSARRIRRAGDAGAGHPRREVRRRHRLPRLGAAPDEHGARAHLPRRRRRLLRPRLRRRARSGRWPAPAGPAACPNAAQLLQEPRLHRRHRERDDGPDPRRRREPGRRRRGLAQGESRRARALARRRHHACRRAGPARRQGALGL